MLAFARSSQIVHSKIRAMSSVVRPEMLDNSLFQYTTGKWLWNNDKRESDRYLPFKVDELKSVAAAAVGKELRDVVGLDKLAEGGFNRTFNVTMRDGQSIIARLPYPATRPAHYATASEVATMEFVGSLGVPVPRVLAYSTQSENSVGSEYIIMEIMSGRPASDIWDDLEPMQKLKIVAQMAKIESWFFPIELPANGSIYKIQDLQNGEPYVPIGDDNQFCIGPDAHYAWWRGERAKMDIDRTPTVDCVSAMKAVAKRELSWLNAHAKPRFPYEPMYREAYSNELVSPDDHIKSLKDYLSVTEYLAPKDESLSIPTLRHPDLLPSNIFISDSLTIVGIIDWQHASVLPLFLHAGIPDSFQNYGDPVSDHGNKPKLPADFDQLDAKAQEAANQRYSRQLAHLTYSYSSETINPSHYKACMFHHVVIRQKLFRHASAPWEGNNATLRADLVNVYQNWPDITSSSKKQGPCPIRYSEEECASWLDKNEKQLKANVSMEAMRNVLGVNIDGWTSAENYEFARAMSNKMKKMGLEAADNEAERAEIMELWPFDERRQDD